MATLATTLEKFFQSTTSPSLHLGSINTSQKHAIHAAEVLGQAAYPPAGCSSHGTLLKEGRKSLDSGPDTNSDSDPLSILEFLDTEVRTSIDTLLETTSENGKGEESSTTTLQELATSIRKRLHDVKKAIRYRLLVGKLKFDECSTPPYYPYYPHALQAENEKQQPQAKSPTAVECPQSARVSSIDGVAALQCSLLALNTSSASTLARFETSH
ncbi:uncharacterized protein PAC_15377 [Phialocephala subalpina]|uniref:Uncharacterized protein n=1 Tax=Phialocephala subalpina TaxID=576137 RepID=A0A1L7XKL2_9HELO|nr:uncharacterized protein PAC_15377 [Phialocephala subalpina]